MIRRTLSALFLAALFLTGVVPAAGTATRTSTFAFLDPGVRAGAMGGAYTALGGEPSALYWNPATLYYQRGRSVEASYADLYGLGLARRTFITYGQKSLVEEPRFENDRIVVHKDPVTGPAYALGLQSLFLDLDENGYSELSVGGAAAWGYGHRVAVGLAVRTLFISSDLDEVSAFGYNVGLGVAWQYSGKERVGLSVPHLLSRIFWKFDSTERLPLGMSVGWNRTFSDRLLAGVDVEWRESETGPYRVGVGAEYWAVADRVVVRGGFRHLSGDFEDQNKPTFGAGVTVSRLRLDYGFRLGPDALGDTHRLGILVGF